MAETTNPQTENGVNRELLAKYVQAAAEKSEKTGKPAATEGQIFKLLQLLGGEDVSKQDRINTYTALNGGVSKRHASVLIDKLLGTFGQYAPKADAPAVEEPAMVTGTEPLPWDVA